MAVGERSRLGCVRAVGVSGATVRRRCGAGEKSIGTGCRRSMDCGVRAGERCRGVTVGDRFGRGDGEPLWEVKGVACGDGGRMRLLRCGGGVMVRSQGFGGRSGVRSLRSGGVACRY